MENSESNILAGFAVLMSGLELETGVGGLGLWLALKGFGLGLGFALNGLRPRQGLG